MTERTPYPETISNKLDRLGILVKNGRGRGRFYDWLIESDLADHLSRPTHRAVDQGHAEVWRIIDGVPTYSVADIQSVLPDNPFLSAWPDCQGMYLSVGGLRGHLANPADYPTLLSALTAAGWIGSDGRPAKEALADGRVRMGADHILSWLDDGLRALHQEFEQRPARTATKTRRRPGANRAT